MTPHRGIGWCICYVLAVILVIVTRPYYWWVHKTKGQAET